MVLTRADLDAMDDVVVQKLNVPEWDVTKSNGSVPIVVKKGEVFIRILSGTDRDNIERDWVINEKRVGEGIPIEQLRVRYAAMCLCDAKGDRLYDDDAIDKLGQRNSMAIERIFDAGQELNAANATAVEDMAKNSEGGPNA